MKNSSMERITKENSCPLRCLMGVFAKLYFIVTASKKEVNAMCGAL